MLTPVERAWLAGFMDADGSIGLRKGAKNEDKTQHSFVPRVTFHNTCVLTLNRVAHLLAKGRITMTTSARKRVKLTHAPMANIEVMGMKRCALLLTSLRPYLVTKRLEADLLLRFIFLRQNRKVWNQPLTNLEFRIHAALKYIKITRHLRDYTPKIGEILDQDIVRTTAKAVEVAEMSTRFSQKQLNERASKLVWYRWDKSKAITKIV